MKNPGKVIRQQHPDASKHYQKLSETLRQMIASGSGKERAFVSAVAQSFDAERVDDLSLAAICDAFDFDVESSTSIGFAMTRQELISFAIRDLRIPNITIRKVRGMQPHDFSTRFKRLPHSYRQSDMWCTVAEWFALLRLGQPPSLPTSFRDFAEENGVSLPR